MKFVYQFCYLYFMVIKISRVTAFRPTVLVTGSTDGIGVTTAKNLAAKGFDVILHGRDTKRIQAAKENVLSFLKDNVPGQSDCSVYTLPPADLSSVVGCQQLASDALQLCEKEGVKLRVLMNNAGVFAKKHVVTEDGLELTFAVNVVAPFIITSRLLPLLLQEEEHQPPSRIVTASSISQSRSIRSWDDLEYKNRPYSAHAAYSESKLLDAMLTMDMSARLEKAGYVPHRVTCNCLDPGTVNTKMLYAGWGPCGIDVRDALDQTWLCSSDEVQDVTGKYFVYKNDRRASSTAYDQTEQQKLWAILSRLDPVSASAWSFSP